MKMKKLESLDQAKFQKNKLSGSQIGQILGGTVNTQWNNGAVTCDTVNNNSTVGGVTSAGDVNPCK
jgi:hypothetical protein